MQGAMYAHDSLREENIIAFLPAAFFHSSKEVEIPN